MSMTKRKLKEDILSDSPEEKPALKRNQIFKEDEFTFPDEGLENKIFKMFNKQSDIILFKKAIFWTEAMKEESNWYEWNTSLKGHDYRSGKYDIDLNLHLNKDVPDISDLPDGKYRLILKYYNPNKRKKNRIFGCIDTQSMDFSVGNIADTGRGLRESGKMNNPATTAISRLDELEQVGQVVEKVGEILNKSLDIHKNTITFQSEIEKTAFEKGYKQREKELEQEKVMERQNKLIEDLTGRLEALETGSLEKKEENDSSADMLLTMLKKLKIIPDIDFNNLDPAEIISKLAEKQASGQESAPAEQ